MAQVLFFAVSSAQFAALETKTPNALYFITDANRIYKGDIPYAHPVQAVTSFPATGEVGTLYIHKTTFEAKVWDGAAWSAVSLPVVTAIGTSPTNSQLPTAQAVKSYVDEQVADIVGGGSGAVVTDVAYSAKGLTVSKSGVPGTPVKLSGLVDGATFDGASGKLTLSTNGGTPIEVNLPVEQFLAAATYDAATHILSLTMTDDSTFDVNLADLVDAPLSWQTL